MTEVPEKTITISSNDLILLAQAIVDLEDQIFSRDCFATAVRIVFMNWSEGGNNTSESLTHLPGNRRRW